MLLVATQSDALLVGYQSAAQLIRSRVLKYVAAVWGGSPGFRDAEVDRIVSRILPVVQAGQIQLANLTDAYIGRTSVLAGVTWTPGVATKELLAYRGVDPQVVYRRPSVTVYTALAGGKSYNDAVKQGSARMMSIIATDLQQAKNRQATASIGRSGFEWFRRVLTGRENCALCAIASTQRYTRGDLMPIHPGCVPGDSAVSPVPGGSTHLADFAWGEVEAVSRRLFEGELVEFVTASDDKVRVTPNHPVLTDKGWVPAHLLGVGDTVFSSGNSERIGGGGPNVGERPALIEDVFDAARVAFPLVRMPLAAEDFHADSAEGKVEIVYTDGNFPTPRRSEFVEVFSERGLVDAHGLRLPFDGGGAFGSLFPSGFAALCGDVGGSSLGGDFRDSHFGGAEKSGNGAVTRFDAPAGELTFDNASVYASQGRNLVGRLSGLVEGERIVDLRRVSWSGHVFNLHTREGWYSSNNHIVSNCDCAVEALNSPRDPGQVVDSDQLELVHSKVEQLTGSVDRGGRLPDYRDLVVTNHHGELGPTLGFRGQHFDGPADIK